MNEETVQPEVENRVYAETWGNGAATEVFVYPYVTDGFDESDRIHLMITDCNGSKRGWLMNVEDAIGIIRGLSTGIQKIVAMGNIPFTPVDEGNNNEP